MTGARPTSARLACRCRARRRSGAPRRRATRRCARAPSTTRSTRRCWRSCRRRCVAKHPSRPGRVTGLWVARHAAPENACAGACAMAGLALRPAGFDRMCNDGPDYGRLRCWVSQISLRVGFCWEVCASAGSQRTQPRVVCARHDAPCSAHTTGGRGWCVAPALRPPPAVVLKKKDTEGGKNVGPKVCGGVSVVWATRL